MKPLLYSKFDFWLINFPLISYSKLLNNNVLSGFIVVSPLTTLPVGSMFKLPLTILPLESIFKSPLTTLPVESIKISLDLIVLFANSKLASELVNFLFSSYTKLSKYKLLLGLII